MPCNRDTCNNYSPLYSNTNGIIMERGINPYPMGANRINAPSWDRDRIMYDFEDVCSSIAPASRYSTNSIGGAPGYGFNSINDSGANSGKLNQTLSSGNWWETYRQCSTAPSFGQYTGAVQRVRYWDNYPTEISFEPIFSDTWFYYLFDTLNGVTGTPCHTYCFTVTYYYAAAGTGGRTSNQINYVYNVTKTPFACPCTPDETYIRYNLEDGLTNPAYNSDPYPTFWSVGTKRNGIAFKYAPSSSQSTILRFRRNQSSESDIVFKKGSSLGYSWLGVLTKPFWNLNLYPNWNNSYEGGNFASITRNETFSNGMVLNITYEGRRSQSSGYLAKSATYFKINSIVTPPSGGWPTSQTSVSLVAQSPDLGTSINFGDIVIIPSNTSRNPVGKKVGVPKDFAFRESKFIGGLYAVTNPQVGQWSTWFNTYAVWTNNRQNNLVGRQMIIVNRKIAVTAGTYIIQHAIDDLGTIQLASWGVSKEDGEQVLSDSDENRIITVTAGFNTTPVPSSTFTVTKSGYINLTCKITNNGTNTSWTSNPGGYAIVLQKDGQTVWTTRDALTGENGGDCFRGMSLTNSGWVDAWDGSNGIPFRSTGPNAGRCWKSNNAVVYKDYNINGGLRIRMKLQSEWDANNNRYNTIWKIDKILKMGSDYQYGDGIDWIDQQKYTMFFPDKNDPNRISITLLISETDDTSDELPSDIDTKRLSKGMTVNGWKIADVKETNDELNMHFAEISDGTADFTKDTTYTVSNGQSIIVKAGWGIKDRAALIGLYEFRKKEIEYGVGIPTEGVPFNPELIKPKCTAEIVNGRVNSIQILSRGRGLNNRNIETPLLVVEPPPTYFNHDLYNQLLRQGEPVEKAKNKSKGTGKVAQLRPVFKNGRLVSVDVIDGGSGYSATTPPNVFVPYIAKKETTIQRNAQDINVVEEPSKKLFEQSEAFKNFANTNYNKPITVIDPSTGVASVVGTSRSTGFNWNDYSTLSADAHKEVTFSTKKPDIQTMTLADTRRTARYENRGVDKNYVQSFKPGGTTKNNQNVTLIKSRTSDKIVPPNPQLLTSADKQKLNSDTQSIQLESDRYTLTDNIGKTISGPENTSRNANQDLNALSAYDSISSKSLASKSTLPVPSENDGNVSYSKEFKKFTQKMGAGSVSALDPNVYISDSYKERSNSGTYINSINTILDSQESSLGSSLDEMWQRDLETNRVGSWNNTEMRVTKQSFFNLPCRSNKEIYLMRRFCPDPRPWTNINIRLGVIKNPPDPNDPTMTVCRKCLMDQPALVTLRSQLRSQFGDNTLTIEDAYCVSYYGLPTSAWYGGVGQGAAYNSTTYAVPFGNSGYPNGLWFTRPGSLRSLTGYQNSDTAIADGCRSYEVAGRLLIYHSLTNETNLWASAVSSYGNPYDFLCGRQYGDSGEEELYNTDDAINTESSDGSIMPGNYIYNINGNVIDSGISQTVPEEGY